MTQGTSQEKSKLNYIIILNDKVESLFQVMCDMNNNVVLYQSNDGLVKMEAIVDVSNETIWVTQKAMAELFGVTVPSYSYGLCRTMASYI